MPGLLASGFGSIVDGHTVACSPDIGLEAVVGIVAEAPGIVAEMRFGIQMTVDVQQMHNAHCMVEPTATLELSTGIVFGPLVVALAG